MTTWLDLAGALLVVLALAVFVAGWSIPAAIGSAGLGVLALSWLIDRAKKKGHA